ncbi:MAG: HAMP domain-containing protein [Actinobacteria bacterium]|nr:HAMP domain-containing protein [Actinomycetota bacterium]
MSAIEREKAERQQRRARLKISVRITAVVMAIFIIASLTCLFSFQKSLNQLADNSKDKVVESVASLIATSHQFVARMIMYILLLESGAPDYRQIETELNRALGEGAANPVQQNVNSLLKAMVESGILKLELGYFAMPPTPGTDEKPIVAASSNEEYLNRQVPDEVASLIEGDKDYRLFENGIPEMGLEGEYLVSAYKLAEEDSGNEVLWYFNFKPMGELLSEIGSFYRKENRSALLALIMVIGLSTIGLIIISFLVLGHLIKKRITKPIEELSEISEEVIEGDMDIRLKIKPREEFSELKRAFNLMISSISKIISNTAVKPDETETNMSDEEEVEAKAFLKPRSTILFQVIALYTIIFAAAGLFFMLSIHRSMNSLIEKSKVALIETEANLIMSSHKFGEDLATREAAARGTILDAKSISGFLTAVPNKTISSYQAYGMDMFKKMIDGDLFDYELVYLILPPSPLTDDYTVVLSSDDKYMYTKPSDEILKFFDSDEDSFIFFEEGIPSMGLNEPYLATSYEFVSKSMSSINYKIVDFKPMGEQVKVIDSFYSKEQNKLYLTMGIVIGVSVVLLIFVTVLALTHLIKKEITGPIDELVVVANEVMEGDLDVQVKIRPGEELESLKRAFNEMIKTLRILVEKSFD